jgi:hypothetical protein
MSNTLLASYFNRPQEKNLAFPSRVFEQFIHQFSIFLTLLCYYQ